jgi:hypothetical protein
VGSQSKLNAELQRAGLVRESAAEESGQPYYTPSRGRSEDLRPNLGLAACSDRSFDGSLLGAAGGADRADANAGAETAAL